ncbi:MAG: phage minor head protein [Oscillospiraceae bacterium]
MNNRQKELLKHQLKSEKEILSELKKIYESSLSEIDEKIQILLSDELTQSKIYRVEYQKALKGQVSAILENLNSNQYESVSDYLKDCYEDGFIGTLYDLQGQGIPLIFPINQEEIVEAIILDSKISEGLYTKMGNNVSNLKKRISSEISRGISTASPYAEIARNIRSHANITVNQSMRIVRTEGNRIHNRSALDAALKAKARGADTVKVWDATLDGVTRPHHRQLDGQVRELEEDFEVDGLTACAPLNFGVAAEDCNCRCVLLTKPRWDLDGAFTKRNNETGELMYFDNVKDYYDFKQKYWDYIDNSGGSGTVLKVKNPVLTPGIVSDRKFYKSDNLVINPKLKNDVKNGFVDAANQVYGRFGRKLDIEKIDVVKSGSTRYMQAAYDPLTKTIKLVNSSMGTYEKKAEKLFADNWNASKDKYGTFYHEIGHAIWEDLSSEAKAQISAIYEAEKHSAYLKWIEAGGSSSGKSQVDFFGKALSRYGATNKNEFFSEAFSQIMSGRMRPVSRQVNQILQEKYASVQLNKNVLDKFEQGGIIKTDEVIGRSVGASAKNYPVKLPDGNHAKFAEGSTITKIKVFAGNGTNVPIRDAIYLESNYGIPAEKWQKVRGEGIIIENGKKRTVEIHWYEADGEKIKMKVKRYLDES